MLRFPLFFLLTSILCFHTPHAQAQMHNATSQPQRTIYNMKQAVEQALQANPAMRSVRYTLLGAQEGRKSALGSFGPSASVQYGYMRRDHEKPTRSFPTVEDSSYTAGLNLHQELFTGFNLLSTYQRAALERDRAQAMVNNAELQVTITVQENFLKLLQAVKNVETAQDSVARLEEQLKVTAAFYNVGLKPRFDVLQAEVDLANAQDNLLSVKNTVATQRARLNTLLNLKVNAAIEYDGELLYTPFTLSLDKALPRALTQRPDLIMAQKTVGIAMENKDIVDSTFYPWIAADFDWSSFGDTPAVSGDQYNTTEYSEWSAAVTARWTFFEWGKTYFASRQAARAVASLMGEADDARQEATFEVKSNLLNVQSTAESIAVNRKAVEAAQEGYRMASARYQAQVGTNEDVLSAQERLTSAEANLTAALANYQIALARTFVSIGEMHPDLSVESKKRQ